MKLESKTEEILSFTGVLRVNFVLFNFGICAIVISRLSQIIYLDDLFDSKETRTITDFVKRKRAKTDNFRLNQRRTTNKSEEHFPGPLSFVLFLLN